MSLKRLAVIAGIVGAFFTSVVGLVTITGWLTAPTSRLSATMTYSPYHYPPFQKHDLRSPAELHRGLWIVNLRNDGDLKSEGVSLEVPNGIAVRIIRKNADAEERQIKEVIHLGDVAPEDTLTLLVWVNYGQSKWEWEKIRLRHAKGAAPVTTLEHVGPFWQWLANWLPLWVALFVLCAAGTLWVMAGVWLFQMLSSPSAKRRRG